VRWFYSGGVDLGGGRRGLYGMDAEDRKRDIFQPTTKSANGVRFPEANTTSRCMV
jgi:hypothetical protein